MVFLFHNAVLLLKWNEIQTGSLSSKLFKHLFLDIQLGRFRLRRRPMEGANVRFHVELFIGRSSNQADNRLHMAGAGEHVHRLGPERAVAQGEEAG